MIHLDPPNVKIYLPDYMQTYMKSQEIYVVLTSYLNEFRFGFTTEKIRNNLGSTS